MPLFRKSSSRNHKATQPIFGCKLSDLPPSQLPIPNVVQKCVEFIENNSLKTKGLFRVPGTVSNILDLKSRFDSGEDVHFSTTTSPQDVCGLFKLFFRELGDPLIPYSLFSTSIHHIPSFEPSAELIAALSVLVASLPPSPQGSSSLPLPIPRSCCFI
ncbi:hypothetical protein GEMRC1_010867 [Eukaryota sp. GEM-RC1]